MIAACLKWVTADPTLHDDRFAGISPADRAALELALRQAEVTNDEVTAVCVGPPAAVQALRDALACGARRAVHIVTGFVLPSDAVAALLANQLGAATAVWCGDMSIDRGTGSVPAYLAGLLQMQQALGVVEAEPAPWPMSVVRRLDGGRREVLSVTDRAVISVEGGAASLRRATLRASLAAASAAVEHIDGPRHQTTVDPPLVSVRPRPRQLPGPRGEQALQRIRALIHQQTASRGELVEAAPDEAAARIIAALREWGYLGHTGRR